MARRKKKQTPLMRQYHTIKAKHPGAVLLFRMGDFYETFDEDAKTVSRLLGITLTERNNGEADDVPMAGFPHHAVDSHLPKLIRSGLRVAICEQTEDPAEARRRGSKSVVARAVVRVVTPGTITEDGLLDARSNNYLACLAEAAGGIGLAWLDMSTGAFTWLRRRLSLTSAGRAAWRSACARCRSR